MMRSRMWRWFKWTVVCSVMLVVTLIASVSALVATETGSRWVISLVADYVPLDVGEVKGNLLTGLDISALDYRVVDQGELQQHYRVENMSFRWQPLALFYSAVSVQSLKADTIRLLLPPASDAEPTPMLWPSFALPVRIELGELQLADIEISRKRNALPAEPLAKLQRISGSAMSLGTFNFRLKDLAVAAEQYSVIVSGRVALRYPYDAQLNVQWQYELPPTATEPEPLLFHGQGDISGDIEKLSLQHTLLAPFAIRSRVNVKPHVTKPPMAIAQTTTPFVEASNQWDMQALLPRWFSAGATLPQVDGTLQIQGWLNDYRATLTGAIRYGDFPAVTVQAKTQGDMQQLAITELLLQPQLLPQQNASVQDPVMQVSASGQVQWSPSIQWSMAVNGENINPALVLPNWPGRMSLAVNTQGDVSEEGLRLTVDDMLLRGRLRAFEIHGGGSVSYDGERWQSPKLELVMGANSLQVQGSVNDSLDVQWQLTAPMLNQLDTHLQGSLITAGHINGSLTEPRVQLEVQADALRWHDYGLGKLALTLSPKMVTESPRLASEAATEYALSVQAENLSLAQQRIRELVVAGNGSLAQHQLNASFNSIAYGDIALALNSGYRDQQWQGQFTKLNLQLAGLPPWELLRSQPMQASADALSLGELCLTTRRGTGRKKMTVAMSDKQSVVDGSAQAIDDEPALTIAEREQPSVCSRGNWGSQSGLQLGVDLVAVPLRQLRSLLKPDVHLAGVMDGQFALNIPPGKFPSAQWQMQTRDGELSYQYADNPPETYRWQSAVANGRWEKQLLTTELISDWGQFGNATAEVSLNTSSQVVAGKAHIDFGDLAPLAAFVPFADELRGHLAADIELRGTTEQPQVLGQLTLVQGSAKIPEMGLELRELAVTLNSYGDGRVELHSRVHSGEGNLDIVGDVQQLGSADWQLNGRVSGDNFKLIDQQQVTAHISPAIELHANQQEIRLTGKALVPSARAEIKSLPAAATKVSDDVIIDEDNRSRPASVGPALTVNVSAELGDDVSFSGFGLSSQLSGKMKVLKTPARTLLTTGYVDVVDGKYKAYGQELSIKRGRLIFQGPYENPGLDIRAQRTLRGKAGHIVGLQIGGTLQRPTSSVYSDPPLQNEGEAMALLLTGKPLSEASAGDAYAIISAMSGLGMDEGGSIIGQIADTFSLDEFKINSDDGLEHSSLWVGKYLTERLFVRYIIGLFDRVSKVGVSYQMSDRLRLEAESGEVQSVDMIYKIEQ